MSEATDLRDAFLARYRSQRILEIVEWDDESATATTNTRIDALAASAIFWFETDFVPFDSTNAGHLEVAGMILLELLLEDNEDMQEEGWYTSAMKRLSRLRAQRKVVPVTLSNYTQTTPPSTRPAFDESVFTGFVPDSPSAADEDRVGL